MKAGAGLTLEEVAAGAQDADGREKIGYSKYSHSFQEIKQRGDGGLGRELIGS